MLEKDGLGVICSNCKGTGCVNFVYTPFTTRRIRKDVKFVIQSSTSYCLAPHLIEESDKVTYKDWINGKEVKSEFRKWQCPKQFDYEGMDCPDGRHFGGLWSDCFKDHPNCWEIYDRQQANKKAR
jgi:hypothetical protein